MRYILAVDAGGSKCDAILLRENGTALGWGHVEAPAPGAAARLGAGRDPRAMAAAMRQAVGDRYLDELYLLGAGAFLPENSLQPDRLGSVHFSHGMEVEPAYVLMREEDGLVAIAGTGAVVHGRTRDGKRVHLDGVGPLLGDNGGGYGIGLEGLRMAARSFMHPRHATSLTAALALALGFPAPCSLDAFVLYMLEAHDRSEIARLAAVVDRQAREGDAVARKILLHAADALAETAWDAIDHLGIAREEYPVIGMGSVATGSDIFWLRVCDDVAAFAPNMRFLRLNHPPVFGMALIGLRQCGVADTAELRNRFFESAYNVGAG